MVTNALRITDAKLICLAAYGFVDKGGKNNKVFRTWFRSALSFPTEVARDGRLSARALEEFRRTQSVTDTLQAALRMLRAPSEAKKPSSGGVHRGEADALAAFRQNLELLLCRDYLGQLARGDREAQTRLHGSIRREARNAFKLACAPHRRTADGLFRIANAHNWFERRLARLLPDQREEEER